MMLTELLRATAEGVDENAVTPGVVGFIVSFLLAAAVLLLLLDMTRRVRRVRYREEVRRKLDAERAEREGGDGSVTPPGD